MEDKGHETAMSQIPVDDDANIKRDNLEDENASIVAVASTVDSFKYENGRRYHAYREGQYWGANDDKNASFEKIIHHVFMRSMEDRLHLAPISDPRHIADLGTGTGLWAMDMGDLYEDAEVLGIDLSPVQPTTQPNVRFEIDDVTSEWTHPTKFDFIHMRSLYGSIADWPRLYQQCLSHLEPGGYLEQVELVCYPSCDDGSLPPDHILYKWSDLATQVGDLGGRPVQIADHMKDTMERAGFVDVVEERVSFPMGPWSSDEKYKTIGKWYKVAWMTGMENWIMAFCTRLLGWTPEQVRTMVDDTRRALEDPSLHAYYYGVIVYGRKPLAT